MPQALAEHDITCPYCYSTTTTLIDLSSGPQSYYEDCQVCCAPMEMVIHIDNEGEVAQVEVRRGNG